MVQGLGIRVRAAGNQTLLGLLELHRAIFAPDKRLRCPAARGPKVSYACRQFPMPAASILIGLAPDQTTCDCKPRLTTSN